MIEFSIDDHIATISINKPAKRNALTQSMWRSIAELADKAGATHEVRCLVLRGTGDDFCAGADIAEFDSLRGNPQSAENYEAINSRAFASIRNCPVPTIAAIMGICFGGGFGLAAACDIRICDESAKFCIPAARLGLAYPVDAMQDIVNALGAQNAKRLTYNAAITSANEAAQIGFLSSIHKPENFEDDLLKLTSAICANAPLSNRAAKLAINAVLSNRSIDLQLAARAGQKTFESDDYAEGRKAFREKRKPVFRGM